MFNMNDIRKAFSELVLENSDSVFAIRKEELLLEARKSAIFAEDALAKFFKQNGRNVNDYTDEQYTEYEVLVGRQENAETIYDDIKEALDYLENTRKWLGYVAEDMEREA